MKIHKLLLLAGAATLPLVAHAQTITSTISDATMSDYNLSASAAWAYYGTSNNSGYVPDIGAFETAVNAGNFSAISGNPSQSGQSVATSYDITGGASVVDSDQGVYTNNGNGSNNSPTISSASFSSTLFASSEVFDIFLTSYQANASVDAVVSNSSGTVDSYSLTAAALPLPGATYGGNVSADGKHGYGDVALTLSGFAVGDSVLFTISSTASDPSFNYDALGLSGVTANAITTPEPSTWALVGLGTLSLFLLRRVRARA